MARLDYDDWMAMSLLRATLIGLQNGRDVSNQLSLQVKVVLVELRKAEARIDPLCQLKGSVLRDGIFFDIIKSCWSVASLTKLPAVAKSEKLMEEIVKAVSGCQIRSNCKATSILAAEEAILA